MIPAIRRLAAIAMVLMLGGCSERQELQQTRMALTQSQQKVAQLEAALQAAEAREQENTARFRRETEAMLKRLGEVMEENKRLRPPLDGRPGRPAVPPATPATTRPTTSDMTP